MAIRDPQIPLKEDIKTKLKAMKGSESYSTYISKLMLSGSKRDD